MGRTLTAVDVDVVATTGYRASRLLKSDIYNDKGEIIGKLDDFIVGSEEEVSVAIVAVGGFLGMVAVPAVLFENNSQGQVVLPGGTRDRLKALPAFQYAV